MNRSFLICLACYVFIFSTLQAQPGLEVTSIDFSFLEDYFNQDDAHNEIPLEDIINLLQNLLISPINLNNCTAEDLDELFILDQIQIQQIIDHRQHFGDYLTLEELQTIPALDIGTIQKIRPFITVKAANSPARIKADWLVRGDNQWLIRLAKTLETSAGYIPVSGNKTFQGGAYKFYTQYRHQYLNHFRYGFTVEKDAGEPWFVSGSPTSFISAHVALRDHGRWKDAVIGDYGIQLGQGLIMNTRFSGGKSSLVMNVKRGGRTLAPYNGVNELTFFRGVAGTYQWTPSWSTTVFFSHKPLHATVSSRLPGSEDEVTSFFESGSFRTLTDINKLNRVKSTVMGYQVTYTRNQFKINTQGVYYHFDKPLGGINNLYEIKRFQGQSLALLSMDYQYSFKNFLVFGESGLSQFKRPAHILGLLSSLSRKIDMSLVYRYLPPEYQAIHHQVFGETGENERGLYWGLVMRLPFGWRLDTYVDLYDFPWLRFRISQPSSGREQLARLTYSKKRRYEWYFQYKWEQKYLDVPGNLTYFITAPAYRQSWRVHDQYNLNHKIQWRSRLELSAFKFTNREIGWMGYQDMVYAPLGSPFSGSARLAYFNTPGFNTRIYAYERDLIYNYSLPFYYGKGWRTYLNLRYRLGRLSLEGRISQSLFVDRETIGEGPDLINANQRTDLKFQIKWNW